MRDLDWTTGRWEASSLVRGCPCSRRRTSVHLTSEQLAVIERRARKRLARLQAALDGDDR